MSKNQCDLQTLIEQQMRFLEILTERLSCIPGQTSPVQTNQSACEAIISSITEFAYDPDANVTFEAWFNRYRDMFLTDFAGQDDAWKVRTLLRKIGSKEHDRYVNFILPRRPIDVGFHETLEILTRIFGDQSSLFSTRYACFKLVKRDADDFITYAGIVNRECERFKLSSLTEDQFKCLIFVCGIQSPSDADLRTRLLYHIEQDPNVTLQKLTAECQRLINLKHDAAMIQRADRDPPSTVHAVVSRHSNQAASGSGSTNQRRPRSPCWHCGEWHYARFCPFRSHCCQKCNRVGHCESRCRVKQNSVNDHSGQTCTHPKRSHRRRRRNLRHRSPKSNVVLATCGPDFAHRRKYITVKVNGVPIRLQLDTASDITIISRSTWHSLGCPPLQPTNSTAQNASGGKLHLAGEMECEVVFGDRREQGKLYMSRHSNLNLLGLDWIEKFDLCNVPLNEVCDRPKLNVFQTLIPNHVRQRLLEHLHSRYASVFQDSLGCCSQMKATLTLRPDAHPVFRPRRPVPYAALPIVEEELDRLQKSGVIQPVDYSSWAAPIVVVKKSNGSIRICADFSTGLNAALESHQYPLPVPDDLFAKLNGGKCFAKLDLSDAYLQIEVDPASRHLLTINTHRGLYQYNRLPFGVKPAPAIFQQIMDTMLNGVPGVAVYLDDIIVMGVSTEELLERLDIVLSRLQDFGFHLRADKCEFFLHSIKYLGFVIDEHGRRPDPENSDAIRRMPPPTNVTTLRSFLGLVSHYSAFLPEMHRLRGPLNQLLTKDAAWVWSPECQQAFDEIKSLLTSDLLLTHYNPQYPIIVAADASNYGVGAVISHRFPDGSEKAVAHAARSLTRAEKNYGQIEKEALAIVFALHKFHRMLYGRKFTLITDHKPLLAIFGSKKGIPVYTANRLQRWATTLLGYDFTIQYQCTTSIGQADALSRLIRSQPTEKEDSVIAAISAEADVHRVFLDAVHSLPVDATMVQKSTKLDSDLQRVIHYHRIGWPAKCPEDMLKPFYQRRHSLSVVNACILSGDRVVIPRDLRTKVLEQLHKGHPGISRMKALARSYVYWPNIDVDIEQMCRTCKNCAQAAKAPSREEPSPWPAPKHPWCRLHIDYAGPINGRSYLIIVDAYSKWPEVFAMESTTASATITKLRQLFSRFGFPETIVSDNGTQFTSGNFEEFCKVNGITHVRTPPYHPQSNGQAERFVDTFKRALHKSTGEGPTEEVLDTFLLTYRMTPNRQNPDVKSPAEMLLQRKIRTPLDLLHPKHIHKSTSERIEPFHWKTKRAFNIGDSVLAKDYRNSRESWTPGSIRRRRGRVIYEVLVGSDIWIRHSDQLRPRHYRIPEESSTGLTLDILLDEYSMHETNSDPPENPSTSNETQRRGHRKRNPVRKMQVNPKSQCYRRHLPRGGDRTRD